MGNETTKVTDHTTDKWIKLIKLTTQNEAEIKLKYHSICV